MKNAHRKSTPKDEGDSDIEAAQQDPKKAASLIRKEPHIAEFLSSTNRAKQAWIELMAGDELQRAGIEREIDRIRAELLGLNPFGIERMLVERIVICTLQANFIDKIEAHAGQRSIAQAELALKRQDRAHRRFLSALKTLAEVRRLLMPAVQVNIAQRAVSVATESEMLRGMTRTPDR